MSLMTSSLGELSTDFDHIVDDSQAVETQSVLTVVDPLRIGSHFLTSASSRNRSIDRTDKRADLNPLASKSHGVLIPSAPPALDPQDERP